ncbi:hypothetical protein T10_8240 [Trichinella papuae]|uniref:Uncharacterized protein n=1 Tax=Trichinella papuae TaxID=268474 RepID=A0A0V1MDZ4_9BILA|nr:hypothetical protein T10_8240 [Trichinella papuae]
MEAGLSKLQLSTVSSDTSMSSSLAIADIPVDLSLRMICRNPGNWLTDKGLKYQTSENYQMSLRKISQLLLFVEIVIAETLNPFFIRYLMLSLRKNPVYDIVVGWLPLHVS